MKCFSNNKMWNNQIYLKMIIRKNILIMNNQNFDYDYR